MTTRTMKHVGILVAVALLIASTPARAITTNFWTNSVSGTFNVGANRSSGTAPASTDAAVFTNNSTYQVTYSAGGTVIGAEYYNATGGVVTNNLAANVTIGAPATFIIGDNAGSTASVVQVGAWQTVPIA